MQSALGPLVRLRTRSMYDCVLSRASWEAPVMVSSKALDEMLYWSNKVRSLNSGKLEDGLVALESTNIDKSIVFCDASGAGYGGFIEGNIDSEVVGSWTESESGLSSTWRELEAVHRVLHSSINSLEGQKVIVNTDNKKM